MNSQKLLNIIFGIFLCVLAYFVFAKKAKVACIDNSKVISSYPGIKHAAKKLQVKELELKAKADTLSQEFQLKLREYEKNKSSMNAKDIQTAETELRMMQDRYRHFSTVNDDKFKKEQVEVTEKAIEEINNVIAKYAKDKGYSIVLGANSTGSVVYADETIDITDEVIKILSKSAK
jgi:outer membrane protein